VSFLQEIRAQILALGDRPLLHPLRTELGEEARLAIFGRYVILFRIRDGVVGIERVAFGGRDLPALFPQDQ
jgi:toxin ParE1/3/4